MWFAESAGRVIDGSFSTVNTHTDTHTGGECREGWSHAATLS